MSIWIALSWGSARMSAAHIISITMRYIWPFNGWANAIPCTVRAIVVIWQFYWNSHQLASVAWSLAANESKSMHSIFYHDTRKLFRSNLNAISSSHARCRKCALSFHSDLIMLNCNLCNRKICICIGYSILMSKNFEEGFIAVIKVDFSCFAYEIVSCAVPLFFTSKLMVQWTEVPFLDEDLCVLSE